LVFYTDSKFQNPGLEHANQINSAIIFSEVIFSRSGGYSCRKKIRRHKPSTESMISGDTEYFFQDGFHKAHLCKGGLQQVQAYKGGEKKPVGGMQAGKDEGNQDKRTGDGPDIMFHFHNSLFCLTSKIMGCFTGCVFLRVTGNLYS
jgi:hypothetical protein